MDGPVGPLFRPEVIEARKERLQGEIVLTQPVRTQVLVLLLFTLVAAAGVWLASGTFTRTETVRGILVTERPSAKIVALRPGQVTGLLVAEGDLVRAGQRLAIIRTEQADEAGASPIGDGLTALESQLVLTEQQVGLARRRAASDRARLSAVLSGIGRQRGELAGQQALQQEAVASARDMFERVEQLQGSGFISRIEVERRRQAYISARQQLAQLNQQGASLDADASRTQAELSRIATDADSEIATAHSSAESLAQQRARLRAERAYVLVAPISGRVAALQTALGRTVDPAVPLMEVVPEGSALTAHVYAPTRAIGFVRPGQEVRLLYDAFPYQRFGSFGGRVLSVSRTVIDPRQVAAPLGIEEPVYRLTLKLDSQTVAAFGDPLSLQPGMTLTANLILDRRSFLDWLLTPLNAVVRRGQ